MFWGKKQKQKESPFKNTSEGPLQPLPVWFNQFKFILLFTLLKYAEIL